MVHEVARSPSPTDVAALLADRWTCYSIHPPLTDGASARKDFLLSYRAGAHSYKSRRPHASKGQQARKRRLQTPYPSFPSLPFHAHLHHLELCSQSEASPEKATRHQGLQLPAKAPAASTGTAPRSGASVHILWRCRYTASPAKPGSRRRHFTKGRGRCRRQLHRLSRQPG